MRNHPKSFTWSGTNTLFAQWVIPGDTITANSQTVRVTGVTDDLHITVTSFGSQLMGVPLDYYGGYLINPRRDTAPQPKYTGYAGGSLVITSSAQGSNDGVVFAAIASDVNESGTDSSQATRTQGTVFVYNAVPVVVQGVPVLKLLWNSSSDCTNCQNWCLAQFALPTVANGLVYMPTYAINAPSDASMLCPTDSTADSTPWQSGLIALGL